MQDTALPQLRQPGPRDGPLPAGSAAASGGPAHAGEALASSVREGEGGNRGLSLYVHVPFCFHKCHYCDFYSIVDTQDRQEVFTQRLMREIAALGAWSGHGGQKAALRTIFVGGGTPSLLRVPLWRDVLGALHGAFDLSGAPEFTVECNPETVTQDLLEVLVLGGVNRVSVGAQSFEARHLKTLERWHDPENVARALDLARTCGITRRSLDLIYAVPGQTLEDWDADLSRALSLGVTHLSCYALTYEPATAMTARLKQGEFVRAPEDLEADMFEHTVRRLRGAGLERYEVSNFAVPGEECRHNLAYWRQDNWLAAGPSASAHMRGVRWKNVQRLGDYLARDHDGFAAITDFEGPDAARALRERLWTGLRLAEGVDAEALLRACAELEPASRERMQRVAARQRELGALRAEDGCEARWRLTDSGFLIADAVVVEFLRAMP